jgi:ubiquinone/menaquinone biosynthesis C-methylase UbiE
MKTDGPSLPDIKENVKSYWDERSKTFDNDVGHGADETECRMWKQYLADIIGNEPKQILDVGTGTGMIAINLAELGHQVTGIDIGEKMMDVGRKKAVQKGLTITFITGDAEYPPFPENTYDCVICRHLLWTLPHPDIAIREWSRVCRPGGLIIAIDGHEKPREYFPGTDKKGDENPDERQKLWNLMYCQEVIEQLPLKHEMTVEFLKSFFLNLHLTGVRHTYIGEISEYQRSLLSEDTQGHDHCEVNIIWGTVQKPE